jgi:hypothetical protein
MERIANSFSSKHLFLFGKAQNLLVGWLGYHFKDTDSAQTAIFYRKNHDQL